MRSIMYYLRAWRHYGLRHTLRVWKTNRVLRQRTRGRGW